MSTVTDRILGEKAAGRVASAAAKLAGKSIEEIESSLPGALAGDRNQVRAYVLAYRRLAGEVLDAVGEARPDLLVLDPSNDRVLVAVEAKPSGPKPITVPWVKAALEGEAMSAPFNEWVGTLGVGPGTAVGVVALLRDVLPGADPLPPPRERRLPEWDLEDKDVVRFYRAVVDELQGANAPLERLRAVMGLNQTELAALFGVRRQALDRWSAQEVPAERQEKLATVGEIADLLSVRLNPDRIPGVVRRAAPAYRGCSILEAIEADEQDAVLAELRDAFDWSVAA